VRAGGGCVLPAEGDPDRDHRRPEHEDRGERRRDDVRDADPGGLGDGAGGSRSTSSSRAVNRIAAAGPRMRGVHDPVGEAPERGEAVVVQ